MNFGTAYLDGSGIYGATPESADKLREFKRGFLKVSSCTVWTFWNWTALRKIKRLMSFSINNLTLWRSQQWWQCVLQVHDKTAMFLEWGMGMIYKESQPVTSWYCIAASHSMAYSEPNSFVLYYRTTTWMDYHIDVLPDYYMDGLPHRCTTGVPHRWTTT